jgi:DNA-binding transcriptional MerR regulator
MDRDQEQFDIHHAVRYAFKMFSDLAFESRNVVGLVGVTERALRHWADRGIVLPDIADAVGRPGVRRRYGFENLVQVAIVRELLRQGINLHDAGRILTIYKNSLRKHSPGRLYLVIQNGTASVLDMTGQPTKALGARLEKFLDPQMARDSFSVIAIHQLRDRLRDRVQETAEK